MKKPVKFISIIIAVMLLIGFMGWMAGAFNKKIPPSTVDGQSIPAEGRQYEVTSFAEETIETSTGTINARDETVISSRILATIRTINVRSGDSVKQGDVLIELDDRDLKSRVEQAGQSVLAAQALLGEARAEFNRIQSLFERQIVSRSEYDKAEASLKSRQAEFQRSQQQLAEANTMLSFTTISSPIEGRVIERYAEPGDTASPGLPLIKIYNPSLLRLDAQVRESLAATIKIGDRLNARIDALDKEVPVIIDEIVPSADPGSRSITVKAVLTTDEALYPGMFGRLLIPTGQTERIYVPAYAISRLGQLEFVEVMEDTGVSKRFVRTGRKNSQGEVEVLSGLQAGEIIILP